METVFRTPFSALSWLQCCVQFHCFRHSQSWFSIHGYELHKGSFSFVVRAEERLDISHQNHRSSGHGPLTNGNLSLHINSSDLWFFPSKHCAVVADRLYLCGCVWLFCVLQLCCAWPAQSCLRWPSPTPACYRAWDWLWPSSWAPECVWLARFICSWRCSWLPSCSMFWLSTGCAMTTMMFLKIRKGIVDVETFERSLLWWAGFVFVFS